MARVTSSEVQEILDPGENYDGSSVLTPYITIANLLITRVNTCATAKGITLSSEELMELERWVAAHAYASTDPTYVKKWTGDAGGEFTGKFGMRLEGTRYGQMALALDPSGCLAAITNNKTAGAFWAGKNAPDQIDVVDR